MAIDPQQRIQPEDLGGEAPCYAHLFEDLDAPTPIGRAIERSNTILYCRRWSETVRFYRDTIGLTVVFENDWFVEFEIGGSSFISVADSSRSTIADVGGQGVTITWRVRELATMRTALERAGVDLTHTVERWGSSAFYCRDPEGHRLEFWSAAAESVDQTMS